MQRDGWYYSRTSWIPFAELRQLKIYMLSSFKNDRSN